MQRLIILACLLVATATVVLAAEDYRLSINGETHSLGLDRQKEVVLADGTRLRLQLTLNDYLEFESTYFTFSHRNTFKPTRTDLGDGITQTMLMTSLGTGVMVQEYATMDPTFLIDLMIKELTKEEVDYGYSYSERAVVKEVGGVLMRGKEAVTRYKGDQWSRAVYAYGARDSGVLVVTIIEAANVAQEQFLIDDFWKSFRLRP